MWRLKNKKLKMIFICFKRVSEFSSYEIELKNRVMQNDVTLEVTNFENFCRNSSFEFL